MVLRAALLGVGIILNGRVFMFWKFWTGVGASVVFVGALLLVGAPANAELTVSVPTSSEVVFTDDCAGTDITITTGTYADNYTWTIAVNDDTVDTIEAEAGQVVETHVPFGEDGDEIAVNGEGDNGNPVNPTPWNPHVRDFDGPCGSVELTNTCEGIDVLLSNGAGAGVAITYEIKVEAGAVQINAAGSPRTLEAGEEWARGYVNVETVRVLTGGSQVAVLARTEPEGCKDETPTPGPTDDPSPVPGAGGSLPETSGLNGLMLFGVGGLALLIVGGGLYLATRRRRFVLVS